MEKVNFFNGMEVENTDLNALELYFEQRINKNQAALSDAGVLVNADMPDGTILTAPYLATDNTTLSVYGFVAYDQEGHLLFLNPTFVSGEKVPTLQNLKPAAGDSSTLANRELIATGATTDFLPNIEYLVVARYNEVYTDDLRKQDTTDVLIPAKISPSVSFYLREENGVLPNDVVLGTLTSDAYGNISVDETSRNTFSVRGDIIVSDIAQSGEALGNVTFSQHVNMLGTGSYSSTNPHALAPSDLGIDPTATGKHQQYEHTNGIVTDNKDSVSSALYYSYMSAQNTSNINDIIFSVQALSADYNEMAAIANVALYPSSFTGALTTILSQSATYSGYYILSLTQNANLELRGPYTSESDTAFINALSDEMYLPICSFYWGEPRFYSLTFSGTLIGDSSVVSGWQVVSTDTFAIYNSTVTKTAAEVSVGDKIYYSPANDYLNVSLITTSIDSDFLSVKRVDETSLKDRRPFQTLSFKNINSSDLSAIKTSAPFLGSSNTCYYGRLISSKNDSAFTLAGKTLSIEFDGVLNSTNLTFVDAAYFTPEDVVGEINSWIQSYYAGPYTDNKPKALVNSDGRIVLLAVGSIVIQDTGSTGAEEILGFGSANSADADGIIKTIISTGNMESIQDFFYDASGNLINVKYTLPSGVQKQQTLNYNTSGDMISFEEEA